MGGSAAVDSPVEVVATSVSSATGTGLVMGKSGTLLAYLSASCSHTSVSTKRELVEVNAKRRTDIYESKGRAIKVSGGRERGKNKYISQAKELSTTSKTITIVYCSQDLRAKTERGGMYLPQRVHHESGQERKRLRQFTAQNKQPAVPGLHWHLLLLGIRVPIGEVNNRKKVQKKNNK